MTPADHADLSAQLARALGYYPESVRIDTPNCCMVFRHRGPDYAYSPKEEWRKFDYLDPSVAMGVLEWLMIEGGNVWNPDGIPTQWEWSAPDGSWGKTDTLPEAIARAAIAVADAKRQQVEQNEAREVLQA